MQDLTGQTLGQYRIVEPLGKGGMATVFKAFQPSLERYVAIKVLPPYYAHEEGFSDRFIREAKAVARLDHPHILPVHDFGQQGEYTYIVMKYVSAGTLKNLISSGSLAIDQVVDIISQIAEALDYAHEQGVIHRDIKPSNVLMDRGQWALLMDFGLAKMVEGSKQLTASGVGVGTPAYMAPEQGRGGKADARSDVYSLGIVLFEMLTGQVPFDAETPMAVVVKHITDPLPMPRTVNPAIPEAVELVILKALAKDPDDRYATAGEMAVALQSAWGEPSPFVVEPFQAADTFKAPVQGGLATTRTPPVADQVAPAAPKTVVPPARRKVPWWAFVVGGLALISLVAVVLATTGVFGPSATATPVPTTVAQVPPAVLPAATRFASAIVPSGQVIFVDAGAPAGGDGSREAPFSSIQQAIDAAGEGAEIKVAIGVYQENITLRGSTRMIRGGYDSKTWEMAGTPTDTIVDGGERDRVFLIADGARVLVERLSIIHGHSSCRGMGGGGLSITGQATEATLRQVIIRDNVAQDPCGGGGIEVQDAVVTLVNSVIANNRASNAAGVNIYERSRVALIHTVVASNQPHGVVVEKGRGLLVNTIVWGNQDADIVGDVETTHCLISVDPLFVHADSGDYHITGDSPAIDAGTPEGAPETDIDDEPRPMGEGVDIGVDEVPTSEDVSIPPTDVPAGFFAAYAYDATAVLIRAIEQVAVVDDTGHLIVDRQAVFLKNPAFVEGTRSGLHMHYKRVASCLRCPDPSRSENSVPSGTSV